MAARWETSRLAASLRTQTAAVADRLDTAGDRADWDAPSVLPGWTLGALVRHLAGAVGRAADLADLAGLPAAAPRELDAVTYLTRTAAVAATVAERAAAPAPGSSDLLRAAGDRVVRAAATTPPDRLVAARLGTIRFDDFLATRCVEAVVHGRDVDRSLGGPPAAAEPFAERVAVTLLLRALAAEVPGRSVEVRVPPYAAVQCLPGPRHTRGTPPNTVECAPGTWLDLATGRLAWPDALAGHAVVVSGVRADLAGVLPVMR